MGVKPGGAWWILGMGAISTYGEEPQYPGPGTVRELTAVATSGLSVYLSWLMPEQGLNIANVYLIFVNGEQVGVSTSTSYEVTGLVPETQYSFAVVSENSYGIRSEPATIDAFTLESTPENPVMNYANTGQFVIVNFDPRVVYSGQKVSGSNGLTITNDIVSIPQNSRYTITAGWTADMEQSGAAPIERKAPKEEFVATGPFKCHGCGSPGHHAPCCANPGGCGCGTFHKAGAFPYDGFWACCEPGYWRWVNYGANYTWSGDNYTNGNGEWWRIT